MTSTFSIVGVGASAGGLSAFEHLFASLPDGLGGMAFVLVQHLAPEHPSALAELIRLYTRANVVEITDGVVVEAGTIYVITPKHDIGLAGGMLHLFEPTEAVGHRRPIDSFFRSLAEEMGARAIGVVLSGTGSDGTAGLRAIKAQGGTTLAQSAASAEFDGMPESAIAAGLADYVLSPKEMGSKLVELAARPFVTSLPQPELVPFDEANYQKLLAALRARTGHDFGSYKRSTIMRRLSRRMAAQQVARLADYVRYLQETPAESDALFAELLIGVTQFFRDPSAFAALSERLTALIARKNEGDPLRVWVPACSTGEEAYSLAILVAECAEAAGKTIDVQVFATDIDPKAIDRARRNTFPETIRAEVSKERLERFFTRDAPTRTFKAKKRIRDMLVFSEQNLLRSPPFSRIDLVSCRNLFIYLTGELQRKLLPLFHYALAPRGLLFLGTSETVGDDDQLFSVLDNQSKIYERRDIVRGPLRSMMAHSIESPIERMDREREHGKRAVTKELTMPLGETLDRALAEHFGAAALLVDARGEILYLLGRTGRYLEPSPGAPVVNAISMAREGLRYELSTALAEAALNGEPVTRPGLRVRTNGDFTTVNLAVRPLQSAGPPSKSIFLVVLEDDSPRYRQMEASAHAVQDAAAGPSDTGAPDTSEAGQIATLRQELRAKEQYLKSANEALEHSVGELKSSNEELQSTNEELQSTNEELETSKEELHSVNEELHVVNAELQKKVLDLSRANNDMNNLLAGTGIATLFLDHELRIQRFTPSVAQVIHVIASDVGRPVSNIVTNLVGYSRMAEDIESVLESLVPKELEVEAKGGLWYSMRIRPYRTQENVIEGAVVTFFDITEIRRARAAQREGDALRRLAVVVRDAEDAITVQSEDGRILAWNPGASRLYGWTEAEALTMRVADLVPPALRAEALARVQELARKDSVAPYRTQRLTKDGRVIDIWMRTTTLRDETGHAYAVATTERVAPPDPSPQGGAT